MDIVTFQILLKKIKRFGNQSNHLRMAEEMQQVDDTPELTA
jgi:hypothetical protein